VHIKFKSRILVSSLFNFVLWVSGCLRIDFSLLLCCLLRSPVFSRLNSFLVRTVVIGVVLSIHISEDRPLPLPEVLDVADLSIVVLLLGNLFIVFGVLVERPVQLEPRVKVYCFPVARGF
jgi:hypothetical protein